jgi:methylthioribose-1-phosphate isomerase
MTHHSIDPTHPAASIPPAVRFEEGELFILDQRLLPMRTEYLHIKTALDVWQAIAQLSVRGAPAIGVAAAYGLARILKEVPSNNFQAEAKAQGEYLITARPTAVNLAWAVNRLLGLPATGMNYSGFQTEAERIHAEDIEICRRIGEFGQPLIKPNFGVLTHCNAGSLAVSAYGTATAPIYAAHSQGVPFKVYANETRPLYQGARLTAWELQRSGVDVTLLCDNMAASLMASGKIDMVLVGTDRVTCNGDVVNKIGTLNVAILCQHYKIPFYVACPSSTFDRHTPSGDQVTIEQRDPAEVLGEHAAEVAVYNPAFDVTPAAMVTGIITDQGIAQAPLAVNLNKLLGP